MSVLDNLNTEDQSSYVNAVNEIVGKRTISEAIGAPLNKADKWTDMESKINGLLSTFKTNMMLNGVTVESGDKFKQLIDKIKTLNEGETKGIKFAEGAITTPTLVSTVRSQRMTFNEPLDFVPSIVFISFSGYSVLATGYLTNCTVCSSYANSSSNVCATLNSYINGIDNTGFNFNYSVNQNTTLQSAKWHAIGVGEEDTTLRDTLASILENKGVDVTEDDDMASLITKVDSIQSFKVNAGTSVTAYNWNGDNTSVKTIGTGSATVTHNSLKWKSSWDGTYSILYIPNIIDYSGYGMRATFYYKILDASGNEILTSNNYTGNDGTNVINNVNVTLQKDQSIQIYISATAGDNGCKIYGGQFYVRCSIDLGGTTI